MLRLASLLAALAFCACDSLKENFAKEREYQEKQKAQTRALQDTWVFKEDAHDLKVYLKDEDSPEPVLKEGDLADHTRSALMARTGLAHLNIVAGPAPARNGDIVVVYEVRYRDYLSEDGGLRWRVPAALSMRMTVSGRAVKTSWDGEHRADAAVDGAGKITEAGANDYARARYRELIDALFAELAARNGPLRVSGS